MQAIAREDISTIKLTEWFRISATINRLREIRGIMNKQIIYKTS
jgi:hypothetical protein